MSKVQLSHRLDDELASWATEYAAERRTSRAVVIEEALRHFRELSKGGVPDLPVVDSPEVRAKRAAAVQPAPETSLLGLRQRRLNKEMGW